MIRMGSLPALLAVVVAASCDRAPGPDRLVLGTTHTLEDSGLLEVLGEAWEEQNDGTALSIVVAGSGEVLALAARGDVDVVLSHSPNAEVAFMADGHGESRQPVMHNDFILIGPRADPAGASRAASVIDAARAIAAAQSAFVSRGDDSGTHAKERAVWAAAGITPAWVDYVEAGSGMADALRLADQRQAYILGDRATFEMLADELDLVMVHEGDPMLLNQYSVIVVKDARNIDGARAFAAWITSDATQRLIGSYSRGEGQRSLFIPDAIEPER